MRKLLQYHIESETEVFSNIDSLAFEQGIAIGPTKGQDDQSVNAITAHTHRQNFKRLMLKKRLHC